MIILHLIGFILSVVILAMFPGDTVLLTAGVVILCGLISATRGNGRKPR